MLSFDKVVDQVRALLQSKGRVAYRTLKRRFDIDDDYIEDLKAEFIDADRTAVDEDGKVLVWIGDGEPTEKRPRPASPPQTQDVSKPDAERRQLTVMFADLVGSTQLSAQLDPEELREVVRAYQQTSAEVIEHYAGHIAQYLGDGLLVYFGYPQAHEDDATRAVRAGLEIVTALQTLNTQLVTPIQVRIGIHTGPVVIGEMGGGTRQEQLALGETPNIAARVQGQAQPDEVVISAATYHLVEGLFESEERGQPPLKGVATPLTLYHIVQEGTAQSRFEVAARQGLASFVGREAELRVLNKRWTQALAGEGQVVLISGEPGIGKSRLIEELKTQLPEDGATQIEFHCSPYHQNSALYPITEHLQRLSQFTPDDTPQAKLDKLRQRLSQYQFPRAETLALLAALLSLPRPEGAPALSMSPPKQKELTQTALVAWLLEESQQTPVYNAWQDLHWADPSTLELLDLLLAQVPTSRLLVLLTFRPEFVPPWGTHSYLSHVTLSRLEQTQVPAMVERVTGGKALPDEVVQHIVTKTDGVPLFVEELTKMVVESDLVRATNNHYELTGPLPALAIPATLQDSLMARLDRSTTVREVAQLGATLGREFSYELLAAVSPLEEDSLQQGLKQLVEAELVYQRGLPPQAQYLFKHALIQDTAYNSLLKSRRQQLHQQVAQVLEQQFSEMVETQPELVAHHYTEAGLSAQAIPYWQKAGQRALRRSANAEAIGHLTKGLESLLTLPDTPERAQQELVLQTTLGPALQMIKGWASSEAQQAYTRARALCQQIGDTPEIFPTLWGIWLFYAAGGALSQAREIEDDLLQLAEHQGDSDLLLQAYHAAWGSRTWLGEFTDARDLVERGLALYRPEQHHGHAMRYGGHDPGVCGQAQGALALWFLGYADQARHSCQEALRLAQQVGHPPSLAHALNWVAFLHQFRREPEDVREHTDTLISLAAEQGLGLFSVLGSLLHGWALALTGAPQEGLSQLQGGFQRIQAIGIEAFYGFFKSLMAEVYVQVGQRTHRASRNLIPGSPTPRRLVIDSGRPNSIASRES